MAPSTAATVARIIRMYERDHMDWSEAIDRLGRLGFDQDCAAQIMRDAGHDRK